MDKNWNWNLEHRLTDLHRCGVMLGFKNKSDVRKALIRSIAGGVAKQVGGPRGPYRLRRKPRS
jgi:hypothetical protein